METQLATFVLLFAFFCYQSDRPYRMGMALALVLYIRPDFVFAVCIIGCGLLYRAITQKKPGTITIPVVTSVLLYLPWVLFVSLYYGSPIPNTIRAKAGFGLWWRGGHSFAEIAHGAMDRMNDWLFASLGPSYAGNGTGFLPLWDHGVVAKVIVTLLFIGVIFAVIKKQRDLLLLYVTLFTYWLYYIFAVPGMFGWYVVPFSALTIILAAKGLRDLLASVFPADAATRVGWVVSASYLLIMVSILPITFTGEKHVQELIEGPVRIAIGKYLKSHSPPDATIGGEPLGYVGYYSERNYIDFPGLTSRRSVDFLTQNGVGMNKLFAEFKPDYLVLRKRESDWFAQSAFDGYWFTQEYVLVRQFDVPESDRARILYASNNVDLDFGLWQRKEAYRVQPWLDFDLWPKNPTLLSVDVTLTNWIRITRENQILPRNRPAYSSYVTADADTGKIVMKATVQPGVEVIAVPVFTGPVTSKLILTVQDEDSGRQIAALSPMPVIYTRWKAWLITLPPSGKERHLAFVGEDQGAEWGEWLAIGEPEILPQFPRPLNHNSPHKR